MLKLDLENTHQADLLVGFLTDKQQLFIDHIMRADGMMSDEAATEAAVITEAVEEAIEGAEEAADDED